MDMRAGVKMLLDQVERDRTVPYWGEPPHSDALPGAEAWLLSLRDWLGEPALEVCRVPSCRYRGTSHACAHKEIDGEIEFWDDSTRPGYLQHRS